MNNHELPQPEPTEAGGLSGEQQAIASYLLEQHKKASLALEHRKPIATPGETPYDIQALAWPLLQAVDLIAGWQLSSDENRTRAAVKEHFTLNMAAYHEQALIDAAQAGVEINA